MNIIEFIEARYREVEDAANAATPNEGDPEWVAHEVLITEGEVWGVRGKDTSRPIAEVHRLDDDDDPDSIEVAGILDGEAAARHIALHDPAYVLADIAAKRKILEECAYWYDRLNARAVPAPPGAARLAPATPLDIEREGGKFEVSMPILLLLALPFADHPEYQGEWAP